MSRRNQAVAVRVEDELTEPVQSEFGPSFLPAGWATVQRMQEAKRMGTYSSIRTKDRLEYEQVRDWLLQNLSVRAVSRMSGWCWRSVAAVRDEVSDDISALKRRVGKKFVLLAMRCAERAEELVDTMDAQEATIGAGVFGQRGNELLMGAGAEVGAQKGDGFSLEALNRYIADLPAAVVEVARTTDSDCAANVANLEQIGGLAGVNGCSDGCLSGTIHGPDATADNLQNGGARGGGAGFGGRGRNGDGFLNKILNHKWVSLWKTQTPPPRRWNSASTRPISPR